MLYLNSFAGCVVTVAGSLAMKHGTSPNNKVLWYISLLITDGSDTIKASLSSEIIQSWLGVEPSLYLKMSDEEKTKIKQKMPLISEKLMSLNALMKISFIGDDTDPEITDITDINRGHLQQLKIRQS